MFIRQSDSLSKQLAVWILASTLATSNFASADTSSGAPEEMGDAQQAEQWLRDCREKPAAQALPACQQFASRVAVLPQAPWQLRFFINTRLSDLFMEMGRYADAEAPARKALQEAQAASGPQSQQASVSLDRLGRVLEANGKLEQAEAALRRALELDEATKGKQDPQVAAALGNLAGVLKGRGKPEQAQPLLVRALAINEAALGKDHPSVAITLSNLAEVLNDRGKPEQAEPLLVRALAINEAALGKDHPQVARTLGNLAGVLQDRGKPEQAQPLLVRALAIVEAALGKDHPGVAVTLSNLAGVLQALGKPEQSEPLLVRALAIEEAALGKDHPQVAITLVAWAAALENRGKLEQAEPLLVRALAIEEAALGKDHPGVAVTLGNLAGVLRDRGKPEQAQPLLVRALAIKEAALSKDHPSVAITLGNLAAVLKDQGEPEQAQPLLVRALAIQEAALGKDHPGVAITLGGLAAVLKDRGKPEQAQPLLVRALAIQEAALGKDHPTIATTLDNLAILHLSLGQQSRALQELGRAQVLRENALRTSPTEDYATSLLATMQVTHAVVYGMPLLVNGDPSAVRLALQIALLNKSRTLEIGTLVNEQLKEALKTEGQKQRYQRMQQLLQHRARLLDQAGGRPSGRQEAKQMLEQAQQLEQELAQEVGLQSSQRIPESEKVIERVARRLPAEAALVEIVLGVTADYRRVRDWGSTAEFHYIALVLYPDQQVRAIDLGTRQQVNSVVLRMVEALENIQPEVQSKAQAAYQQVFAPIERELSPRKIKRVVVAPDEVLELIPWGALHDGTGYLNDRYELQYVEAGRDLLKEPIKGEAEPAVVLADPAAPGQRRLDAARKVSLELAKRMGVHALVDQEATEESLRSRARPYTMLLAAHGEYRPEAGRAGQLGARRKRMSVLGRMIPEHEGAGEVAMPEGMWSREEAMHWSALALAPGGKGSKESREDGRLTGDEVKELNLRGTQLVTMLACQSGRGAVSSGQGVYGIRRALLQAGAETVASTLWSVEEGSASELVKRYYEKLLSRGGKGRVEAMQEAMKEVRGIKEHPEYSHPYYWAPFIVMGQDGPLHPPKRPAL